MTSSEQRHHVQKEAVGIEVQGERIAIAYTPDHARHSAVPGAGRWSAATGKPGRQSMPAARPAEYPDHEAPKEGKDDGKATDDANNEPPVCVGCGGGSDHETDFGASVCNIV